MAHCHLSSIKVLETLMEQLPSLSYERCLSVAEGDGRLIKDMLRFRF